MGYIHNTYELNFYVLECELELQRNMYINYVDSFSLSFFLSLFDSHLKFIIFSWKKSKEIVSLGPWSMSTLIIFYFYVLFYFVAEMG